MAYVYEETADDGSSPDGEFASRDVGTVIGSGLLPRSMEARLLAAFIWSKPEAAEAERLPLDRLMGREKLSEGRWSWLALFDASEFCDGDRGRGRAMGVVVDMGECGVDMALPEDDFRG